ncbi:MAG: hypothetical protein JO301_08810 [Chitinophagaceae bacterium]|nr:hypothetical protein [Chitinophagaceae bacterium]
MKRFIFLFLTTAFFIAGCKKDTVKERYSFYRPVYRTKSDVRSDIRNTAPQAVKAGGKLVWKDHYVFLNDLDRGVHIIDIADPYKPKQVSFIRIPGCEDLAVNGNYLYADCFTELVTIDISDPQHIALKAFIPAVFPGRIYPGIRNDTSMIITDWIKIDTLIEKDMNKADPYSGPTFFGAYSSSSGLPGSSGPGLGSGTGTGGSMARFALQNQRLYTVGSAELKVFNTSNAALPAFVTTVIPGTGGIETIYPYQDKLFIGCTTGMFVFSTQNPDQPVRLSRFEHARTCDPVIADGDYAYVTLRSTGVCGGTANQLDLVNISNILSPKLVQSYALKSPGGLSKDGNLLFICDGTVGLKVFDASNLNQLVQIKQFAGFTAYDVIAAQGIAIVAGPDGLHLFDYSNPAGIKQAGTVLTTK